MVEGLVSVFDSGLQGPYNIGNPQETTVLELAQTVIELCGSPSGIKHVKRPDQDPTRRRPDISRIRSDIGWEPAIGLKEGLIKTIEYFRALRNK
jgi:nucleoside-diphosphate-sugar epimerase